MTSSPETERLGVELEAAALRAIASTWDQLNDDWFHRRLRLPAFALSDAQSRLGCWLHETRTIEIGRHTLLSLGWGAVVEVLKHEMAHQFVDEVLGKRDEPPHGPTFQRVCAERGFDSRAAGTPEAPEAATEASKALDRIAKLLALAESPNLHEAQSAMNAAQKLLLKYNLDAVRAREVKRYGYKHLGAPTGRIDEPRRLLGQILQKYFFVDTIWVPVWMPREGRRGTVLEVVGTRDNLEMAEYVFSFLHHTSEALWSLHKRAQSIRGDKDRRAYLAGVMTGFYEKLASQETESREAGLVWVGDRDRDRFMRSRHPRIRTVRHSAGENNEARLHGREAGRHLVLHRGMHGHAPAGPRLLGSG